MLAILLVLPACARSHPWSKDLGAVKDAPAPEKRSFKFLERDIKGLHVTSLEELAKLPDEEVDIATGALLVSKLLNPGLDIKKYQKILDNMAKELAKSLKKPLTPREIVERLRLYFFQRKGFGRWTGSDDENDASAYLLDKVLQTRRTLCAGLSLLYLCIAERLGIPLAMVEIPASSTKGRGAHCFIRYSGSSVKLNIETTKRGIIVPDSYYTENFKDALKMSPRSCQTTLSKKETVASVAPNVAVAVLSAQAGKRAQILSLLEKAAKLRPNGVRSLYLLGTLRVHLRQTKQGMADLERAHLLAPRDFFAIYSLFYGYKLVGHYDKAVEFGREFLEAFPKHPDAPQIQLELCDTQADSCTESKYLFTTLKECDAAMKFVREYPKQNTQLSEMEEELLKILPSLLERRKQELLREKEK